MSASTARSGATQLLRDLVLSVNPAPATLTITGDELRRLDAHIARFIAMTREFRTVPGEHDEAAFRASEFAFRSAAHQLAETTAVLRHGTIALEWMRPTPQLGQSECECGNTKRLDARWCVECGTHYQSCPEQVDGAEVGL